MPAVPSNEASLVSSSSSRSRAIVSEHEQGGWIVQQDVGVEHKMLRLMGLSGHVSSPMICPAPAIGYG